MSRASLAATTIFTIYLIFPAIASAALNLAIEAGPDPAEPGESLRVAITVTNPSGSPSGAITLELPYPANLASVSELYVSDNGDCINSTCDSGETIFWSLPSLGPGEGTTVTFAPTVLGSATAGSLIVFDVDARENGSIVASSQRTISVVEDRVFNLVVDDERDPVATSSTMVYEITFGNRSAETTTSTSLEFRLPDGTNFLSASDGGVLIGNTVEWSLGNLVGHEGGRRTVTVSIESGLGEGIILQSSEALIEGEGDFLTHRSQAQVVTRVEDGSRLWVGMSLQPDPAIPGEIVHSAITVTNPTNSFATDVVLRLRFPSGLKSHSEDFISDAGNCSNSTCDPREELIWSLGDLPPGRGVTVTLAPMIDAVPGGSLVQFPVSVDATGQSRSLARQTLLVRQTRALDLAVDFERSPIPVAAFQTYTLVFGNRSAETVTGTSLFFPLPENTTFISASDEGVFQSGGVTWNLGTLVGHEGGQRQVKVRIGGEEGDQIVVDPATLTGQGNFFQFQTLARSRTRVENGTRLSLAVAADRDPVVTGERQSVRITVSNRSPIDFADDLMLQLRYPAGFSTLDEDLVLNGGCINSTCEAPEFVSFNLGDLPPGSGRVVELPPVVSSAIPGGSVVQISLFADATDRSRTHAVHSVLVRESRTLDLAVDVGSDPIQGSAVYELTLGNRSGGATTGTTLRFPVPAGTTASSASNGGTLVSGGARLGEAVEWNLGTLTAGETRRMRVALEIPPSTTAGHLIRVFDAEIRGQGAFFEHRTRSRDARRIETLNRILSIESTPQPVLPNSILTTDLKATNASPNFLFGASLQLRFPEALFNLNESSVSDGGGCPNSTCDEGEIVSWALGDLPPGAMVNVSLPPVVSSSTPEGSLVRWWSHLFASTFGQAVSSRAIPVGNDFTDAGPLQPLSLFTDGFESGNTSAWSNSSP